MPTDFTNLDSKARQPFLGEKKMKIEREMNSVSLLNPGYHLSVVHLKCQSTPHSCFTVQQEYLEVWKINNTQLFLQQAGHIFQMTALHRYVHQCLREQMALCVWPLLCNSPIQSKTM